MAYRQVSQDQMLLLPPCLGDLIGGKDLCRVVSRFVDALPRSQVEERFRHRAGAPAYHPRMMLKVILYAYTQGLRSSRQIARVVGRDVHFMWLAGLERPDFNTINRFRSDYLKELIPGVFAALCEMLVAEGYVREEEYFLDGTVMGANAGRHTHVWRKNTERLKERVQERVREILDEVERVNGEEDARYGTGDLPEKGERSTLSAAAIANAARAVGQGDKPAKAKQTETAKSGGAEREGGAPAQAQEPPEKSDGPKSEEGGAKGEGSCNREEPCDQSDAPKGAQTSAQGDASCQWQAGEEGRKPALSAADVEKAAQRLAASQAPAARKAARALEREAGKLRKYEAQEATLGSRNSYSKTDPDAAFMRTKDGALVAAYNVQAGTQDGFITGISVGQSANDGSQLAAHMAARKEMGLAPPAVLVTDAAYGSEENYAYLEDKTIEGYVKYPSWFRESKGRLKPYEKAAFLRDEAQDIFLCSQGRRLRFVEESQETSASGYMKILRHYECENCADCPVKSACTRSPGNRRIQHSPALARYQREARERLASERGIALRRRRAPEIETVFAHIKHNRAIRRFHLRGLAKVTLETLWIALAHNLTRLLSRVRILNKPWNPGTDPKGRPLESPGKSSERALGMMIHRLFASIWRKMRINGRNCRPIAAF